MPSLDQIYIALLSYASIWSDNGLLPVKHQAITWNNRAAFLLANLQIGWHT